jgi:putative ATPase
MLKGGEEPKFIARRMIILASEDIGNADPYALTLATSAFTAVDYIGMPEAQLVLAQCATYLASAPKSNASMLAIAHASGDVNETGELPVPLHIRNAPTKLMKDLNYGKDYKYSHDYEGHFENQQYLPDELKDKVYYKPTGIGEEAKIKERLKSWWKNRKR